MPDPSVFTTVIDSYLPEPHASLLNGILFGIKLDISDNFYHVVKITGLLHIVVLSGINITLLGALIGIFTKGLGRKISAVITISAIVLFVMFVGADPPVTRAAIMGVLTLIAVVFERKTLALYSLFLSACVIAVFKFEWIKTVSFQLSFGATLGIMLFGSVPHKNPKTFFQKSLYYLQQEMKPTLAAQVFTVPTILFYFRELSVIAPIANIVVSFVMPPLMVFGLLTAILGKVHYILGIVPAFISYGLLHYVIVSIYIMAGIPHIFFSFNG